MPHRPAHVSTSPSAMNCLGAFSSGPMRAAVSTAPETDQEPLDLALREGEPLRERLNGTPLRHHQALADPAERPAPPVPKVIYAERRPRLSGPELLAKYGANGSVPVQPNRPDSRRAPRLMGSLPRIVWWSTLALGTITQSAGMLLI